MTAAAPAPSRLLLAAPLLAGTVLAVCLSTAVSDEPSEPPTDPWPIRRVLIPPEQLPREMERLKQGVLRQMPRADFEDLVLRATRASATKEVPRLTEARYRARLTEGGLEGSGQWKVLHAGPRKGLLPLQQGVSGFNLALRQVRIMDNHDALLADFDGRTPALLIEGPGEHTVILEWSARGEARPEGIRFELRLPPCPVAQLELDLPADRIVTAEGALVEGPSPAEVAERRWWKISCGGRSLVSLLVRPGERSDLPPPLVQAWLKTTQALSPEGVDATFDFDLRVLHQGVRELVFECDPVLRPYEVSVPGLETWELKPGTPSRLTVRLREPLRDGPERLQIRCAAPLDPPSAPGMGSPPTLLWVGAGIRLTQAISRGETLVLKLHPELRIRGWSAGDFRLEESASEPDAEHELTWQRLTLVGGGVVSAQERRPAGSAARRPQVNLLVHVPEFRARQLAWWRVHAESMSLTLQIHYEVSQGRLFQLRVRLPAQWAVDRVELSPAGLLRHWGEQSQGEVRTLWVDLLRPLTPASGGIQSGGPVLTVRLRPRSTESISGRGIPVPDAWPLGARYREGALAIDYDEKVDRVSFNTPLVRTEPEEDGPWGPQVPDEYYPYRGQAPEGTLVLRPRPPQVRARCTTEVSLAPGRALVETQLLLEAEGGSPQVIDLTLSAPTEGRWRWQEATNTSAATDRAAEHQASPLWRPERLYGVELAAELSALGASNPLQAAVAVVARPRGERWRLFLDRPLQVHQPLLVHAHQQLEPTADRWEVPLPVVLNTERLEGEVTLHLTGADRVQVEAPGLREAALPAAPRPRSVTAWRTFRYSHPLLSLTLQRQGKSAGRSTDAVIEQAALTTDVESDGVLHHSCTFRLANWSQPTLPLHLPAAARLLAVRIDGLWLPQLPAVREDEAGLALELPVPRGPAASSTGPRSALHHFELVYETITSAWLFWSRLEAPAPRFPIEPIDLRQTWRLPPGVSPLSAERFRRLPGPGEGSEPAVVENRPLELLRWPLSLPHPWPSRVADSGQQQALADAAQALRSARAGQTLTFRQVLDQLLFEHLRNHRSLVVDAAALRAAAIGPETPLAIAAPISPEDQAFPWESLGVVLVQGRSAALLTTADQRAAWQKKGPPSPLSEALEVALNEAVLYGQDASGRFRSAAVWTRKEGAVPATILRPLLGFTTAHAHWTEWEPLPEASGTTSLLVIRHAVVSAAGLAVAALLGLALWFGRRRPAPWLPRLLASAITVAGLALVWLPVALAYLAWWPLLVGCAGLLLWYLRAVAQPLSSQPSLASASTGTAAISLLLLFSFMSWNSRAAPPAAPDATVYLLPESGRSGEKPAVLVPTELLDQLQAVVRSPANAAPVVLLGASYKGQVVDGMAEFNVEFSLHCQGAEEAAILIPLEGVQLQGEVWLDGAPARPTAAVPPQVGYLLKARGRGRHKVEMSFRVPLLAQAEEREVQFGLPRLLQSRLVFRLPSGATHVRALGRQGALSVLPEEQGERLEVDLGRIAGPLRLCWHLPARPSVAPTISFQDAFLWDLRPDGSTLTGLVRYTISRGAVETLLIDLPTGLEVRGVEILSSSIDTTGPRLRDWRVVESQGERQLRLTFASLVSGDIPVALDLVPRAPLSTVFTLPVPRPRGHRLTSDTTPSFLGYRARGLEVRSLEVHNVVKREPAQLAAFWPETLRPDPTTILLAYRTWADGGRPPVIQLRLDPHPTVAQLRQELVVHAGLQQADVTATAELSASAGDLCFVEWHLSLGLMITAVNGADVRHWIQSDNRLLVWLEGTRDSTRIDWSGWMALSHDGNQARLIFPRAQLAAKSVQTTLRLQAGPGLMLVPGKELQDQFRVPADFRPSDRELVYLARQPDYSGMCSVRPTTANAEAQVLTVAEVREGRLTFTSRVRFPVIHGELRSVQVRLRNWDGEDVRLQADQLAQNPTMRRGAQGDRTWTLDLKPGVQAGYQLQLTGSMPLEEMGVDVPMPDVMVLGDPPPKRWLAVCGGELAGEAADGLTALADTVMLMKSWPNEAERLRRVGVAVWQVGESDWRLRLVLRQQLPGLTAVRVYLTERSARVTDGRRWLHEAVFWLRHEANTDLNITLPAAAELVTATVDDVAVTALQADRQRVWMALPGRAGLRQVRLRWLYLEPEPVDQPNLARLQLDGTMEGPVVWTVTVPPGWKALPSASDLRPGAGILAALNLHRASALLACCRQLTEGGRERGPAVAEALAAAQLRFHQLCQEARHFVELTGDSATLTGPRGQTLQEWLSELLAKNQEPASRQGFADVRLDAEPNVRSEKPTIGSPWGLEGAALAGRGTPVFVQTAADSPPPRLLLVPQTSRWTALFVSGQWLVVAAVVWALSFFPAGARRLRPYWPEQVMLLAFLGWYLAGPTLAALFLLVLGVCGRLVVLGSWASTRFQRPPHPADSSVQPRT